MIEILVSKRSIYIGTEGKIRRRKVNLVCALLSVASLRFLFFCFLVSMHPWCRRDCMAMVKWHGSDRCDRIEGKSWCRAVQQQQGVYCKMSQLADTIFGACGVKQIINSKERACSTDPLHVSPLADIPHACDPDRTVQKPS